jgi:hypothetical protein
MTGKRDKTIHDLSVIYSVGKAAISYWIKRGLKGDATVKPGGHRKRYLFSRQEVDDWLRENKRGPYSKTALAGFRKRTEADKPKPKKRPKKKPKKRAGSNGSTDQAEVSALDSIFDEADIPEDPKERKLFWDAAKAEIVVRKSLGQMVPAEEVQRGRVRRVEAIKAGLLSLPGMVSDRLVGLDSIEIDQELNKAVRRLLKQYAEG